MSESSLTAPEQERLIKLYQKFEKAKGKCVENLDPLEPLAVIIETLTAEQVLATIIDEPRKKPLSTTDLSNVIIEFAKKLHSQGENNYPSTSAEESLYGELSRSNLDTKTTTAFPEQVNTTFPMTSQYGRELELEREEDDSYAICQKKIETEEEYAKRFPNLPKGICPRKLYISTLKQSYLNALYFVDPSAYPDKWDELRKRDPIQAWHSLNQTVIKYTNKRWKDQGIVIREGETAIDFYNINDVKSSIVETIDNHLKNNYKDEKKNNPMIDKTLINTLEKTTTRLDELYQKINSDVVKLRNLDINPPTLYNNVPNWYIFFEPEIIH